MTKNLFKLTIIIYIITLQLFFEITNVNTQQTFNKGKSAAEIRIEANYNINASFFEFHEIPNDFIQKIGDKNCNDAKFNLVQGRARPDFFLVGCTKCGTTSFYEYIGAHPNVKRVKIEAPNFFSWGMMKNVAYQSLFSNPSPLSSFLTEDKTISEKEEISGDFSQSSLAHPLIPRRIYSQIPYAKIIILLRNPIDRAYSHYVMNLREFKPEEALSFEEIIARELTEIDELRYRSRLCYNNPSCDSSLCFPRSILHRHNKTFTPFSVTQEIDLKDYFYTSYLFRSIYDDQVERWMQIFPSNQILILQSEDLFEDNIKIMQQVSQFLHLPFFDFKSAEELEMSWGGGASKDYEPRSYSPMNNQTREALVEFFKPYNDRLFRLIGKKFDWD